MFSLALLASIATVAAGEEASGISGTIYVIRHGEKVSTMGDLNDKGKRRAEYIADIFDGQTFQTPKAIFASHYSGQPQRTLHTVQPLGTKLGLNINNDIHNERHKEAAEAMFQKLSQGDDVVLAAWEHLNIKGVCEHLGVDKHVCGKWPGDDYDSVYVFTYDGSSKSVSVSHHPVIVPSSFLKDHENFAGVDTVV